MIASKPSLDAVPQPTHQDDLTAVSLKLHRGPDYQIGKVEPPQKPFGEHLRVLADHPVEWNSDRDLHSVDLSVFEGARVRVELLELLGSVDQQFCREVSVFDVLPVTGSDLSQVRKVEHAERRN